MSTTTAETPRVRHAVTAIYDSGQRMNVACEPGSGIPIINQCHSRAVTCLRCIAARPQRVIAKAEFDWVFL